MVEGGIPTEHIGQNSDNVRLSRKPERVPLPKSLVSGPVSEDIPTFCGTRQL